MKASGQGEENHENPYLLTAHQRHRATDFGFSRIDRRDQTMTTCPAKIAPRYCISTENQMRFDSRNLHPTIAVQMSGCPSKEGKIATTYPVRVCANDQDTNRGYLGGKPYTQTGYF